MQINDDRSNRCHAFAAGYDIRDQDGYDTMMRQFDSVIGLAALKAIHLNDSKTELVRPRLVVA